MIAAIAEIADNADKCEGRPALALEFPAFPAITLVSQRFLAKSRTASVVLNDSRISESRPAI
jgi:hypothetical protein